MTTISQSFWRYLVLLNINNDSLDMNLTFCKISCTSNNRKVNFDSSPRTFGTDLVLWKYVAHLTVFQKIWLYFINYLLKVKVEVIETRNWPKICHFFSYLSLFFHNLLSYCHCAWFLLTPLQCPSNTNKLLLQNTLRSRSFSLKTFWSLNGFFF